MSKRLVHIYKRVYHRSTTFAIEKPNMATAVLIGIGIVACIALWAMIVPIFAPAAIGQFTQASAQLPF